MAAPITFGLDISHHQPLSLDLAQARRDGCELCIIKGGQGGNSVDEEYAANLAEAEAVGMLTAVYWFLDSRYSAAAHVELIKKTVPKRVAIIPDVESIKDSNGKVISAPSLALTRAVIGGLLAAGYVVPLMYLPRWYWQTWGAPSLAGLPPLWSSRYPDMVVGTLPDEWADVPASYWDGYGGLPVLLLQFTSSARIAGYQPLDANAFRGTRDQLAALLGASVSNPSKEAEDMQPQSLPYAADFTTAAFPVEVGSNSAVVKEGWVTILSTFGPSDYELIAIDGGVPGAPFDGPVLYDNNEPAPSQGTLGENSRLFAKLKDGCDGIALKYKNNVPGARLGIAFPHTAK